MVYSLIRYHCERCHKSYITEGEASACECSHIVNRAEAQRISRPKGKLS